MPMLLLASRSAGKVKEYTSLLSDLGGMLIALAETGIGEEVDETGATFEDNARLKARRYARLSGLPTLSDDSGLEVDALGGAPGVHTARFGGPGLSPAQRWALLLERLRGLPAEGRTARFRCVVAVALPGGSVSTFEGTLEGRIALAPAGAGGFGYDPVFCLPERGCTLAELPEAEKNRISHRARAVMAARPYLRALLRGEAR